MTEDKQFRIDIPESIEGYKVTLFWGLTIKQIILVFIAILFVGFGVFYLAARHFFTAIFMLPVVTLALLGIVEIRGRNFYRYVLFIIAYYKTKPKVLIYSHYAASGTAAVAAKQLVYQKQNHNKIFVLIITAILFGLLLLTLVGIYLYHVIHK